MRSLRFYLFISRLLQLLLKTIIPTCRGCERFDRSPIFFDEGIHRGHVSHHSTANIPKITHTRIHGT